MKGKQRLTASITSTAVPRPCTRSSGESLRYQFVLTITGSTAAEEAALPDGGGRENKGGGLKSSWTMDEWECGWVGGGST